MAQSQKILFRKMNRDTEDRLLPSGQYRSAWNLHVGLSEGNKGGTPTSLKGTIEMPWNAPPGLNTCVGSLWDERSQSFFAMWHNSLGNHTITRGYPNTRVVEVVAQGDNLEIDKDSLITGIKFVDNKLLYWTNFLRELKKINVNKANNTGKKPVLLVYFPQPLVSNLITRSFGLSIYNGPSLVYSTVLFPTPPLPGSVVSNPIDQANTFAQTWNSNPSLSAIFSAEACGTHVELTALSAGDWNVTGSIDDTNASTTASTALIVVSDNRYDNGLTLQQVSRAKWPPPYAPSTQVVTDNKKKFNYISRKVFQFALAYHYDDWERSAMSPYSPVVVNELSACDTYGQGNNAIEIDFSLDPSLSFPDTRSIIRGVELFVREGNEGVWKSIEVLPREKWVYDQKYLFLNDGVYSEEDPAYTNKLYDYVPIRSKSFEVITDRGGNNRGVDGGIIEGYDNECIQANLNVTFDESVKPTGKKIIGNIYIRNLMMWLPAPINTQGVRGYYLNQPIHNLGEYAQPSQANPPNPGTVYGGFGPVNVVRQIGNRDEQWLPEAGWPVYLAGTRYYAISKQNVFTYTRGNNNLGPTLLQNNVYDSSQDGYSVNLFRRTHRSAIRVGIEGAGNQIYSTYEIEDVPPGRYVMRIASHLCSHQDKLGKGSWYDLDNTNLAWQRTSTYLMGFGDSTDQEVVVQINDNGSWEVFQAGISVASGASGDVVIPNEANIADLTDPSLFFDTTTWSIYQYDNQNQPDSTQYPLWNGTPVELAFMVPRVAGGILPAMQAFLSFFGAYGFFSVFWTRRNTGFTYSDHNGFSWFSCNGLAFVGGNRVDFASATVTADPSAPSGSYNPILSSFTNYQPLRNFNDDWYIGYAGSTLAFQTLNYFPSSPGHHPVVFYNSNSQAYNSCRTSITGRVVNGTQGVPGVTVVSTRGSWTKTASDGSYSIVVWGDTTEPTTASPYNPSVQVGNRNNRLDQVTFSSDGRCLFLFPSGNHLNYEVTQFEPAQQYSRQVTLSLNDIFASLVSGQFRGIYKRGFSGQFGLLYKDSAGRMTFVQTADNLKLSIPFYTEDLNLFDPAQYAPGTYSTGVAQVGWTLLSPVPRPKHGVFTHYQWVRTKNEAYNGWLQWVIKEVKYAERWDEATTQPIVATYGDPDVKEIYLDISNLNTFKDENTDSLLGYVYSPGDRLRLIRDENGNLYTSFIDVPITGQRDDYITIEANSSIPQLFNGVQVEIYTPQLKTTEKFYYEICSDTYAINDPYTNPTHSQTSGIFTSGDGWLYNRQMPSLNRRYTYLVESQSVSDFFSSRCENIGRVTFVDVNAHQLERPTGMRITNPFIPASQTNGLSSMEGLNIQENYREFGLIQKFVLKGDLMIAICSNRRTFAIYVGDAILKQADGTEMLAVSDDILGAIRPLEYHAGTLNPESVVEWEGEIYWFDRTIGEAIMYSSNGLFPISSYGMRTFFSDLGKTMNTRKGAMPGVFDRYHKEYILTVPGVDNRVITDNESVGDIIPGYSLAYFTPNAGDTNGWTTFYSFDPDYTCMAGNSFVSMKGSSIWLHNQTTNYNEIWGTRVTSKITPVCNMSPSMVKSWLWIVLETLSKNWRAKITNNRGQESELIESDFRDWEGQQKADFYRDVNTPGVAQPLFQGDVLKSEALTVELENSDLEQISIFACEIGWITSNKTS